MPLQNIQTQLEETKKKAEEISGKVETLGKAEQEGFKITPQTTVQQAEQFLTADRAGIAQPPLPPEPPQPPDNESLLKQLAQQRKILEEAHKAELERINKQLEETRKREGEFRAKTEGTLKEGEPLTMPFREETERMERERLKVEENFFAKQALVNELEGLLTESTELTKRLQQQRVPGLSGLQQSQRMIRAQESVQGRIAVIEAVMQAREGQIGTALNFIDRTITAITQDRQDRLNYLNTLANWYETQRTEEGKKIFELTKDQEDIFGKQMKLLEDDLERTQKTADKIRELMIDPEQANLMAEAGITLNDSEEEISKKMSDAIYGREIRGLMNELRGKGVESILSPEGVPSERLYTYTDSRGKEHYFRLPEPTGRFELRSGPNGSVVELEKDASGKVINQRTVIEGKAADGRVYGEKNLPGDIRNSIIEDLQDTESAKKLGRPLTLAELSSIYPEVNLETLRSLMDEFYDYDELVKEEGTTTKKWWEFWK